MNNVGRPAVLLDRDGTIIVERDYLSDPALVELERGAAAALRRLAAAGWMLVVVTNQSGVARNYFDLAAVEAIHARLDEMLRAEGVEIAGWYVCPHGPDDRCACRKPAPELALRAARDLDLDLAASWVIGDKPSDVGLGHVVGARSILVRTGHADAAGEAKALALGALVMDGLEDAAAAILEHLPA